MSMVIFNSYARHNQRVTGYTGTNDIYYMIASNLMFRLVQKLAVPVPPAKHEIKVCPMCWYPKFWGEPVYTTPI